MMFCYMIVIAGGDKAGTTSLATALCNTYSHKKVTLLQMESYRKPEEELPMVTLESGRVCRDCFSPESFDLARMRADIDRILTEKSCRILVVEGLLALWDEWINEVCDLRVFAQCESDIRLIRRARQRMAFGESFDEICEEYTELVRARHEQYVVPSKEEADLIARCENGVDEGVWIIRKALRGLML